VAESSAPVATRPAWRLAAHGLRHVWAAPATFVGVALALPLLLTGGRAVLHTGVLEVSAPGWLRRGVPFDAITFGHVVLARSAAHHGALRGHERVHVRQYEALGALMLLAYPMESAWQALRGACPYRDNRFEVQARRESGELGARCDRHAEAVVAADASVTAPRGSG